MKNISAKKASFNDYRFAGLAWRQISNEYVTMKRTGEDRLVVKVADAHLLQTKFGFALILDRHHVIFLKDWQVSRNYFGNEVLLQKAFFTVKEWGCFDEFEDNAERLNYSHFEATAAAQDALVDEDGVKLNKVRWSI